MWQKLELASELESDLRDTAVWGKKWFVDFNAWKTQLVLFDWSKISGSVNVWGKKWFVDFNAWKTQLVLFDWSKISGSVNVKMDGSVLEEK